MNDMLRTGWFFAIGLTIGMLAALVTPAGASPNGGSLTATLNGGQCQLVVGIAFDPALYPDADSYVVAVRMVDFGPPLGVWDSELWGDSPRFSRSSPGFRVLNFTGVAEKSSEVNAYYATVDLFDDNGNFIAGAASNVSLRNCDPVGY